ncbi:MAG: AsmA family protein, partial [Alphaproteobacteria bacterium]
LPDYHPASAKLGSLQLHAKLAGDGTKIGLGEVKATLGPLTVAGSAEVALGGARPKVTLRLATSALDLDPFLPADDGGRGPIRRPRGQAAAASARWSTAPVDLAALKAVDADVTLAASSLAYGQYRIEGVNLSATLDQAVLALAGLTGKLYGGELKIAGTLDGRAEPKASLSLRLDGANLGDAGLKLGELKLRNGMLSAAADLATSGGSELALVRGLNGSGALKMQGGTIDGLDLSAVNARLAKPARAGELIGLVQAATSGGETRIEELAGTFTVRDGVGENKDLAIAADGATGKGEGNVDLPRWYMDYETAFKLAGVAEAPPFFIKLKGAPDEPRKFLNANEFQEWLVKREAAAVGKALGKGSAQPGGNSPEGVVQDILKSLQKK